MFRPLERAVGERPPLLRRLQIVDPCSGRCRYRYRYYTDTQCERAMAIRHLRVIGMPLDTISAALSGDENLALQLLDSPT